MQKMNLPTKIFAGALLLFTAEIACAAPDVLATVKPVHSLASAVMEGVGTPDLLVGGGMSVHDYALKPSDARKVARATLIFEIGPDLETWLDTPLKSLAHGKVVVLERAPGVKRLAARKGGVWLGEEHEHRHGGYDPHIWLDPQNAVAMTQAMAEALAQADPVHARRYRDNAARSIASLKRLDGELKARLAPVRDRPFLVFHDAYQYFETRYGLKAAGAVTVSPDRPAGPRRIAELRRTVASGGAVCLFREPQFSPKLIATIGEATAVRTGVLDPLGADIRSGPDLYPALMRQLAQSLTTCLKR
jgi:zinc transport system substrate-binding protein